MTSAHDPPASKRRTPAMRKADIPHLGQHLVDLGHRLETQGEQAWAAAREFAPGPKARTADPTPRGGGSGDPTGTAAGSRDRTAQLHERLSATLTALDTAARDVTGLMNELAQPRQVKPTPGGRDVAADGWCQSCHRLDRRMEPIAVDRNGHAYHARHCRWCGTFKAVHGIEPPLAILRRRHHQGRRISLADVEKHCPHCRNGKAA